MEELMKLAMGGGGAGGALDLVFGKAEQIDASKYAINTNSAAEDNKTLLITLSFIGGILLIIIIAIIIAMK